MTCCSTPHAAYVTCPPWTWNIVPQDGLRAATKHENEFSWRMRAIRRTVKQAIGVPA